MPVSEQDANPIRFDGPPRVIGLGFQVSDAKLIGPVDLFDDPAFDPTREESAELLPTSEDTVHLNLTDYLLKKWNILHYLV